MDIFIKNNFTENINTIKHIKYKNKDIYFKFTGNRIDGVKLLVSYNPDTDDWDWVKVGETKGADPTNN